ncbi:hypothetical protein SDC9_185759 [bioreactor metagenome]|uniref:Uncharacterized protein n=1 Tax=bioreactor metagenome TaxID=1076179 RepID=A0A645HGR5_9ZZZZ
MHRPDVRRPAVGKSRIEVRATRVFRHHVVRHDHCSQHQREGNAQRLHHGLLRIADQHSRHRQYGRGRPSHLRAKAALQRLGPRDGHVGNLRRLRSPQ